MENNEKKKKNIRILPSRRGRIVGRGTGAFNRVEKYFRERVIIVKFDYMFHHKEMTSFVLTYKD